MKLYYGSDKEVINFNLNYFSRTRDFSKGVYLTSSLEQAISWAKHKTYQREKVGRLTISIFEINEKDFDDLVVKKFGSADKEWLEYITKNRTSKKC